MKREIKFRAWDNVLKQHLPNIQNHIGNDDWAFGNILKNTERYTVEQYTGLKDRNGFEIYEGDILKFFLSSSAKWNNQTVYFSKGNFMVSASILSDVLKRGGSFEVIGNIHENK